MSLFGKILTVFNALIVGGLVFVVMLDYARREAWSDNYLQHELIISGLPWNERELDARGGPRVEALRQTYLEKTQGARGEEAVKTQAEALAHIQKRVNAGIEGADGVRKAKDDAAQEYKPSKAKSQYLMRVLTALAEDQTQRQRLATIATRIDAAPDDSPYLAHFQLTDRSLQALQADGVPADTVTKLEPLKGREFATRQDLDAEVEKALGAADDPLKAKVADAAQIGPALVAELDDKFAAVLFMPPFTIPFTVADQHAKLLKPLGLSDVTQSRVMSLKGQSFATEKDFEDALGRALVPEDLQKHKTDLLRWAFPPTPVMLGSKSWPGLKADGVPDDVLKKLEELRDKEFGSKKDFEEGVAGVLGADEAQTYTAKVVNRLTRLNAMDHRKALFADLYFRLLEVFRAEDDPEKALLESKPYQRFLTVVGVAAATRAVDHYAESLQKGAQEVRESLEQDRDRFAAAYRARLAYIETLKNQVDALTKEQAEAANLLSARQQLVKNRTDERDEKVKELDKARKEAADLLKQQKFIEDSLFKSRQELRDAFEENKRLEQMLRTYEQGR